MTTTGGVPFVIKAEPSGRIVYTGPDVAPGWLREPSDDQGNFQIDEGAYEYTDARGNRKRAGRPVGCVYPARRPGRYIKPGQLPGTVWNSAFLRRLFYEGS